MRRCSRNGETVAIMALAPVTNGWALAQAKAGVVGGLFAITPADPCPFVARQRPE
jgi:hypothetical protein